MKTNLPLSQLSGRLALSICTPGEPLPSVAEWSKNTVQFGAADVIGRLLTGDTRVVPNGFYLEFRDDLLGWSVPTNFGRQGYDYFHGGMSTTDVLRVPLLQTAGYAASSTIYASNQVTFIGQSAGADPVLGKNGDYSFTRSTSYIVGGGLIAMPDADDWTQDIVLTRGYVSTPLQRPADPNEVMVRWQFIIS